jgi:hypothetical protein
VESLTPGGRAVSPRFWAATPKEKKENKIHRQTADADAPPLIRLLEDKVKIIIDGYLNNVDSASINLSKE